MNTEIVYLGRSRTNDILLRAEDVDGVMQAVDLSTATKITLSFGDVLIESLNADGGSITWDKSGYAIGEVRLNLGAVTMLQGYYEAALIVYDSTHPNGLPWGYVPAQVWEDQEATESGLENYLWTPNGVVGVQVAAETSEDWFWNTWRTNDEQHLIHRLRESVPVIALEGTNTDNDLYSVHMGPNVPRHSFGPSGVWDFVALWYGYQWIIQFGWWYGPNTQEMVFQALVDGRNDNEYIYGDIVPPGNDYTQSQYADDESPTFSEGWWRMRFRVNWDAQSASLRVWDAAGDEPETWDEVLAEFAGGAMLQALGPMQVLFYCQDSTGILELAEFGWARQ